MSCSYDGCPLEIRNYCTGCPIITNWCDDHSNTHENEPDHYLISITNKNLNIESFSDLNLKIQSFIFQIVYNTEKVIIALKKASNEAIKSLKKATRNMKNISELERYIFSQERISCLVDEVGEILNNKKISTLSKISDLKQELHENYQNIRSLTKTLEVFEEKERERVKGHTQVELQAMNKSQNCDFLWNNFGDKYRTSGWSKEYLQEDYRELLYSDDGKYCFFCNQY